MFPLRCRRQTDASAASRSPFCASMHKKRKKHRLLPAAVPTLLLICLLAFPFFQRPAVVYAQDRVSVTRVREYFPPAGSIPELEIYYPQLSFGGNPNQLQTANAMIREYAVRRCHLRRKAAKSGNPDFPPDAVLVDYQVTRNSGGFFSIVFTEHSSLAGITPQGFGFTIRLSDQKVCQLADLFLSNTNYTSLLDQEISRMLQIPFEGIQHDSPFFLTDDSIVLLPNNLLPNSKEEKDWLDQGPISISLSTPAVSRQLTVGLSVGHTRTNAFGEGGRISPWAVPEESPEGGQEAAQDNQS